MWYLREDEDGVAERYLRIGAKRYVLDLPLLDYLIFFLLVTDMHLLVINHFGNWW